VLTDGSGLYAELSALENNDVQTLNDIIHNHPNFPSLTHVIIDLLNVDGLKLTAATLREVAAQDASAIANNPAFLLAIVARTEVVRGMADDYRSYLESENEPPGWKVEVFESVQEARFWIKQQAKKPAS